MDLMTTEATAAATVKSAPKLIDLRDIGWAIRRRRLWILATIILVIAMTVAAYLLAPRRFSATASVALDRQIEELVSQNDAKGAPLTDSPSVDTEVQVLTSPALARKVVDSLHLDQRVGFGQAADGPKAGAESARLRAMVRLIGGLEVRRLGTSYAIGVGFTSPDPDLSTAIVNRTVDQYVADQREGKVALNAREGTLLRERLERLRFNVLNAESAVARYRSNTNLIDINKDSTSVQQEISVLNTQLASAQADAAAAQARRSSGVGGSEASPLFNVLRQQQAQLSAQRAQLSERYGALHPEVARIDQQLADVNTSVAREVSRIRSNQDADARVASSRAGAINSSLSRAKGQLQSGNNASVQLSELSRNAEAARSLYQSLLDRYQQSLASQGTERSNAYVIAHALVPRVPTFPNATVFAVAGILAALIAAGAVVLALEFLETGLKTRQDVESTLGLPVLASVPDLSTVPGVSYSKRNPLGPADYLLNNEGSVFGEAFRSIRTALHIGYEGSIKTIAITSALPEEGKTTVAICLARSCALSGLKTVLVDCDVRRRASSRTMAATAEKGLTDVLRGDVTLANVLQRDEPSGAWILPQGDISSGYDLIMQPAMADLIAELRNSYDIVVLDSAPVLPLADARAVAAMADGVLLITRWRKTPAHAAELAADLLGRAGAKVVGAALTLVNLKEQSRSGSGDEMMYYHRFKEYYT